MPPHTPAARSARAVLGLLLAVALLLAGCGSYRSRTLLVEEPLAQGDVSAALAALDKLWLDSSGRVQFGKRRNEVLYYLDRGMLLQLLGRYEESQREFDRADQRMTELEAKSVSREAATWLINDTTTEYAGEPFEKVLVNYYKAMNFLPQGKHEEALVEFRQVYEKLNALADKFGDKPNRYNDDPFVRYLMGMAYEATGADNDAYIAYRNAYEAWNRLSAEVGSSAPHQLIADMMRLGPTMGFDEDVRRLHETFPDINAPEHSEHRKLGEIIVIAEYGEAPYKEEDNIVLPGPQAPIRISVPRFVRRPSSAGPPQVMLDGQRHDSELGASIATIAQHNLEDRVALMTARIVARAVAKQTASRHAEKQAGLGAKFLVDVFAIATEQADTRSWLTLPDSIAVVRLPVQPGSYEPKVWWRNGWQDSLGVVTVAPGEKVFLHVRTMR